MTEEKKAINALANGIVKAMKSAQGTMNITNVGSSASTVPAAKITGLPAVIASIFSSVESSAAQGDAIAQQLLDAVNHIAAGEFETITADTAMIEKVYATFGDFITLVAEDAQIGDLDVEQIRAGLADVGLINIGSAVITTAQIERASTGTLFVREEIGGSVYIDDLAVSEANIVSLAAGKILLNNSNGDLVELYVDETTGQISTRATSYDGNDIINTNTLNGNRIVQNSITTDRLNASEIFAANGTVMNLVADNINATRLFANQGFIPQLETTVIASTNIGNGLDITGNSSITLLNDRIDMFVSNMGSPYIQTTMPAPVGAKDAWFNPDTEEHFVPTGEDFMAAFPNFAEGDDAVLKVEPSDFYTFSLGSNGYLLVQTDEVTDGWSIKYNGLWRDGLWRKVENVAYSRLKITVDGIVSEVYDSETGASVIRQNADQITAIVQGDTSVPYVQTSSVTIRDNSVNIASTGNVNIQASQFNIGFNTSGSSLDASRVEISNNNGIRVTDQYGNYFQATYNKLGLYGYGNTPKLYMDNNGNAVFAGNLSAVGGTFTGTMSAACITSGTINADRIGSGTITSTHLSTEVNNSISTAQSTANSANDITQTIYISKASGTASVTAPTSLIADTTGGQNIWTLTRPQYSTSYPVLFVARQTKTVGGTLSCTTPVKDETTTIIDGGHITTGTIDASMATITNINASNISTGTLNAARIGANSIAVEKLTGSISNNNWILNFTNGTFTIGDINANNIKSGTLTLGGANNVNGTLVVKNANNTVIGSWNNSGLDISYGNITIPYYNSMVQNSYSEIKADGFKQHFEYVSSGNIFENKIDIAGLAVKGPDTVASLGSSSLNISNSSSLGDNSTMISLASENCWNMIKSGSILGYDRLTDTTIYQTFEVSKNRIFCTGSKSRLVKTDQYSDRLLYCYETPSPMFGDIGEGVISEDGKCYIYIDPVFSKTIVTNQYQVALQKYGDGDCWVSERNGIYFIVEGTPGLAFGWEMKAKQRDYDQKRLDRNDEPFTVPRQSYGNDAANYIEDLKKGRIEE